MVYVKWPFFMMFFMLVVMSFMIPAYAEVNSFQTNQSFYIPGNKIYFTGTVGIGDYQKQVNLVIHGPTGKFVLISGNFSDSIYTFEIIVNTNDTNQFSTKGTYSATAFVGDPSNGKTITFDFSPDGSPVIHQVPENTSSGTTNSGQPTPQHFMTQLNENVVMNDVAVNLTKTNPSSTFGNSSAQFDFKNILYPVISLCGVGIVIAVIYFKKMNLKSSVQKNNSSLQSTQMVISESDDDAIVILKNRLARWEFTHDEFIAIKDALSEL